jgi:hypothetical protein
VEAVGLTPTGDTNSSSVRSYFYLRIKMKKRTEKVQAKMDLLKLAREHAFLEKREQLAEVIQTIDDKKLEVLVVNFIAAKIELEAYLKPIRAEIAALLPDDDAL